MRLLIRNGTLVSMDSARSIRLADIAILGDRIVGVGNEAELKRQHGEPDAVVEARDRYVLPGLVNAHTHAYQAAFRGLGDGLRLERWQREVIQPIYRVITPEDVYWFTLAGAVENIRSGVTTILNFQAYPNDLASLRLVAAAVGKAGLRALLVKSFYGPNRPGAPPSLRSFNGEVERVFSQLHDSYGGRVRICVGPPNALLAPKAWIRSAHRIAVTHGSGVHTHLASTAEQARTAVSELGAPAGVYLDSLGVIDERFIAAHCVALDQQEIERLAQSGGHIVHCPVSNMYLGDGVAKLDEFAAAGINVALGSDGPATNNNQDMFAVMKMASLMQKGAHLDPSRLPPGTVLEMATSGGAKAVGVDSGSVEPGRLADLVVIDLGGVHNQPVHRPASAMVYSAHSSDVESVIVGGEVIMHQRTLRFVDVDEVTRQLLVRSHRVIQQAGLSTKHSWPWS